MDALFFDPYDLENLRLTLDEAVRVRRPNEFYLWAQGALQGFLPHETLVCVFEAGPAGEAPVEIFSRAVLAPEAEAALYKWSNGFSWLFFLGLYILFVAHYLPDAEKKIYSLAKNEIWSCRPYIWIFSNENTSNDQRLW